MPGNREEDFFKKYSNFTLFKQKLLFEWGVMEFTISCLLTPQMLHANLVKIGPVVLEKKMLTHGARRTTTDANP